MSKVMVSLPDDLLARVDAEVRKRSTNRSAFLAAAAARELERRDPAVVSMAIERSRQRFARAGSFESAAVVRAGRDQAR